MSDAERQPPTGEQETAPDPLTMPMDDLKALIDTGEVPKPAEEPEAKPDEKSEPEPKDTPAAESGDTETEKTPADEKDPEASDEEKEPTLADLQAQIEELSLQNAELDTRSKGFERKLGQRAGREGHLQQQHKSAQDRITALQEQLRRVASGEQLSEADMVPREPVPPRAEPPQAEATLKDEMQRAGYEFSRRNPHLYQQKDGAVQPQFVPSFLDTLKQYEVQIGTAFDQTDPQLAAQQFSDTMDAAAQRHAETQDAEKRKTFERKRADQAEGLKEKKRAAAVSTTTSASAEPERKAVDPMNMPLDELKDLIESLNKE